MDGTKYGEALWTMHLEHMRAMDEIVERGCMRGERGVLLYLYHVGHPLYPGELTEKLGLTTERIANILKVLEKGNLIVRSMDAEDRRRVRVALTPEGEAAARRQNAQAVAFHERIVSRLEPEEARNFVNAIRRMTELMESELRLGAQ